MWYHLINWPFPCNSAHITPCQEIQKTWAQVPWLYHWEARPPWLNLVPCLPILPQGTHKQLLTQSLPSLFSHFPMGLHERTKQNKAGVRLVCVFNDERQNKNSKDNGNIIKHNYDYEKGLCVFTLLFLHLGETVQPQIFPSVSAALGEALP